MFLLIFADEKLGGFTFNEYFESEKICHGFFIKATKIFIKVSKSAGTR
jgi:hypothetical protein